MSKEKDKKDKKDKFDKAEKLVEKINKLELSREEVYKVSGGGSWCMPECEE